MMAFDRTPTAFALDSKTVEAIRAVLARSLTHGNHAVELRELLCQTATEARNKGIQAERLLVILKDVWYSIPDVASARSSAAENALLQKLISRCIEEYYAF